MANLCDSKNYNTGLGTCDKGIGKIGYVVVAPDGASVKLDAGESLFAFLKSKVEAPLPAERWYVIPKVSNQITNSSTEPVVASLADGTEEQVLPGNAIYQLEWWSRMCADRIINRFNQYDGPGYIISLPNKWLIGKEGEGNALEPLNFKIGVSGGGFMTTDTTPNTKKMKVNLGDELEFQNMLRYLPFAGNTRFEMLKGYRDLNIRVVDATGGVATVQLVTGCEDVNVYDQYRDAFGDASMWRADGSESVISSVTADDTGKSFLLTVPSGSHLIELAPVDVLKANGVSGYEGLPVWVDVAG